MRLVYPARLKKQTDGSFLVTFRDLPEALTDGDDRADAAAEAADCLDEAIAGRINRDEEIPTASQARRGEVLVAVPLPTAAKAALAIAMRSAGLSKSELARRLSCDVREVRRLTDPRHRSHTDRLAEAIRAAGGEITVSVAAESSGVA